MSAHAERARGTNLASTVCSIGRGERSRAAPWDPGGKLVRHPVDRRQRAYAGSAWTLVVDEACSSVYHRSRFASLTAGFSGSNAGNIFGDGLYLAEDLGKADQYCTVDKPYDKGDPLHEHLYGKYCPHPNDENPDGVFYALVCRAALGYPVRTQQTGKSSKSMDGGHPVFATSAGRELSHIPDFTPPTFHHSLFAELGPSIVRYRECVMFHSEQVCPRYLIAYQRLAPGVQPPPQWEGVGGGKQAKQHSRPQPQEVAQGGAQASRQSQGGGGMNKQQAMSFNDKVQVLRDQLGLASGLPAFQVVASAVKEFGLAEEASGLTLVEQLDAVMAALGVSSPPQSAQTRSMPSTVSAPPLPPPRTRAATLPTRAAATAEASTAASARAPPTPRAAAPLPRPRAGRLRGAPEVRAHRQPPSDRRPEQRRLVGGDDGAARRRRRHRRV